jgi:hypothetical protein
MGGENSNATSGDYWTTTDMRPRPLACKWPGNCWTCRRPTPPHAKTLRPSCAASPPSRYRAARTAPAADGWSLSNAWPTPLPSRLWCLRLAGDRREGSPLPNSIRLGCSSSLAAVRLRAIATQASNTPLRTQPSRPDHPGIAFWHNQAAPNAPAAQHLGCPPAGLKPILPYTPIERRFSSTGFI